MGRPDPTAPHEGIEKVNYEEFSENSLGRVAYHHRFDIETFPMDRDFEVEWVDGPVRFIFKRDDHADYWKLRAEPSGEVVAMRTGYDEDDFNGSSSGGGLVGSTVISPAPEEYQETFDEGGVIYSGTYVDLSTSPFTLDGDFDIGEEGIVGFNQSAKAAVKTTNGYHVTQDMVEAQLRVLARHAAEQGRKRATIDHLKDVVAEIREYPRDKSHVHRNKWLKEMYDTAYLLGLRDKTAHATAIHDSGYTSVSNGHGEDQFGPVAKRVAEAMWKLGKRDKPFHVQEREYAEHKRREYEQRRQQQQPASPPTQPENRDVSEKNNTCPECEGRYHKKDLTEDDYDQNYSSGTVWRCPDCDSIVAGNVSYHGPEPEQPQTSRRRF